MKLALFPSLGWSCSYYGFKSIRCVKILEIKGSKNDDEQWVIEVQFFRASGEVSYERIGDFKNREAAAFNMAMVVTNLNDMFGEIPNRINPKDPDTALLSDFASRYAFATPGAKDASNVEIE